jgi:hypothetical protein
MATPQQRYDSRRLYDEARSRFGSQSASELGALVACSIPEQLPGTSPHQQGKDEDGNALARDHLVRALLKQRRHAETGRLAVLRLITTSNLTGAWTGARWASCP